MSLWQRPKKTVPPGIYNEIVSTDLAETLKRVATPTRLTEVSEAGELDEELFALLDGAIRLAIGATNGTSAKLRLAEAVLKPLQEIKATDPGELVLKSEILKSVGEIDFSRNELRPKGSLLSSGLITNSADGSVLEYLASEFASADRIDLLCSFIKVSGLDKFRFLIENHVKAGKPMRVLTTTYMRATEAKAIDILQKMGVQVRISYDDSATRLHAKAWLFHRDSQYSSGYVGSSNLSHSAQTEGLEWNVRITQADQEPLLEAMSNTFETYWRDGDAFEPYDGEASQRERLQKALTPRTENDAEGENFLELDLEPRYWQKPILRELTSARTAGRHKNLVLMATGTGKTWVSAFDYQKLLADKQVDSLLFIAHRKEILTQARRIFGLVLGREGFGELWVDGAVPTGFRHVFASVQSVFDSDVLETRKFDYVVIDEAHHSAAESYLKLLSRLTPKELLGMTATPERADGKDYADLFPRPYIGNLRVWEAIQQQILVPFRYFTLDTDVDLSDVTWNGKYVDRDLSKKLIDSADLWLLAVARALREHVALPSQMRALAFCVDIDHAKAVSERLGKDCGLKTRCLDHSATREERRDAKLALHRGEIQVLCVVDLFNEGVDIPNVNTLFLFRPTESATVFLQQIGRGLRRSRDKDILTIFDLTGRQHPKFKYGKHLRGLLGMTNRELGDFLKTGFGKLPSGCQIHFEEQSHEEVLRRIRASIPSDMAGIISQLKENLEKQWSLEDFLRETEVDLLDIYRKNSSRNMYYSWDALRREVGLQEGSLNAQEAAAIENVHKLLHVRDSTRLEAWKKFLKGERPATDVERRLVSMLFTILYGIFSVSELDSLFTRWMGQTALRNEIVQLIPVLEGMPDLLPVRGLFEDRYPLITHGCYLDVEISAALGALTQDGKIRNFYSGVVKALNGRVDVILTTLQKGKNIQEHLKYKDFALDEHTFHWQSQAGTRQNDTAGIRHIRAEQEGVTPLLFVRDSKTDERNVTRAYRFLGPAKPAKYYGERPITVEWEVETPMMPEWVRNWRIAS